MSKYAILFIPDASYLYHERIRGSEQHGGKYLHFVDEAQSCCLYTFQETKNDERYDQKFDLKLFDTVKEAEKRFTKDFWVSISTETNYIEASYIEYNNEKYELTDPDHRIYFEIVEVKNNV